MDKLLRTANAARDVVESIGLGFAQMGSMGTLPPPPVFRPRSDAAAIASDWDRVGADMRKAINEGRALEKAR